MNSAQPNLYPNCHIYQPSSPSPAADSEAVCQAGQPSLPPPVVIPTPSVPIQPPPVVTQPSSIVRQPAGDGVNTVSSFRRYSQDAICPSCKQSIITKTEYRIGGGTWFMCVVVFCVGGFFGCCFFPFIMKSCKDVVHRCPACNTVLARKPII